jgi:acetyl esterase
LRAEGSRYADRLKQADALVDWIDVAGVDHGYDVRVESPEQTRRIWATIVTHLRQATTSA